MAFSEKQLAIMAFPYTGYDSLICSGAIRSGKTAIMTVAYVDWAMREFSGQKFIIMGKTVASVERNVVEPFMALAWAKERWSIKYSRQQARMIVRAPDGRENWFDVFGAKDKSSYELVQGFTAAGCFVDEVALCEKSAVNQALARCSVTGSRYFFSCNPDSPRHWFYTDWILRAKEQNALVLEFELHDNPSLSEAVIERYERQYTGVFYDRYIRGKWVVAEGLVYPFAEEECLCTPDEAWGWTTDRKGERVAGPGAWYVSIDYGITNPFAALLWRVTPDRAYVVDEYVWDSREEGSRKTDEEHYAEVERLVGDRMVQAVVVDPSANSFKETVWRHERFDVLDGDNAVVDGIGTTSVMLKSGLVKVSEDCTRTVSEFGLYRWDDSAVKDRPIKENDHCMDSLRYCCNTVLKYELDWDDSLVE